MKHVWLCKHIKDYHKQKATWYHESKPLSWLVLVSAFWNNPLVGYQFHS